MTRGVKPQAVILTYPDGRTIRYPNRSTARNAIRVSPEKLNFMIETGCPFIAANSQKAHLTGTTADLALD